MFGIRIKRDLGFLWMFYWVMVLEENKKLYLGGIWYIYEYLNMILESFLNVVICVINKVFFEFDL